MSPLLQSNLPGLALGTYSATDPQSAPEIITATGYWGPWLAGERYATGAEVHNAFDGGQYIALQPSLGVRPDTEPASWIAVGSLVAISGEVATYREGLAAARPAAGVKGRIYYATDTGTYSLDTGTAWLRLASYQEPLVTRLSAVNTEVKPGELVITTAALTVTLPPPTFGMTIGVSSATPGSTIVKQNAAELIYGDFLAGQASITLAQFQHVELVASGTSWFVVAGEPKREQTYGALTARTKAAEIEPSATRPAFVTGAMFSEGGYTINLYINGTLAQIFNGAGVSQTVPVFFYVPAGQKYKWESVGATVSLNTAHILL